MLEKETCMLLHVVRIALKKKGNILSLPFNFLHASGYTVYFEECQPHTNRMILCLERKQNGMQSLNNCREYMLLLPVKLDNQRAMEC